MSRQCLGPWGVKTIAAHRFGSLKASFQTVANTCPVNVSVRGGENDQPRTGLGL